MSVDVALIIGGICAELAVIALLLRRGIARLLPFFFSYMVWSVLVDATGLTFNHSPRLYFHIFEFEMPLDSLLVFGVLVELTWAVLRPVRASFPRRFVLVIAALIVLAGAAVWPLTGKLALHGPTPQWYMLMRLQQTFSILRVLFFLGMAAFSQVLAIGWRDRELQVATGLGFYSLASLAAAFLHTHPAAPTLYHHVDQVVTVSYFCSLLYWVVSFVQKEAPRQEFSPRMQSLLLSVAGAARANRLAIEEIRKSPRP